MSTPISSSALPDFSARLFAAKAASGQTFEQIGHVIGRDEVWVAAAFYGQAKFSPEELEKVLELLGLKSNMASSIPAMTGDQWWPHRGLGPTPPTDPVIYRLYEAVLVYGEAIKAVIHEKHGDGIMSMIDCKVHVEKKPDPNGDRVVLSFDGKFLPYARW